MTSLPKTSCRPCSTTSPTTHPKTADATATIRTSCHWHVCSTTYTARRSHNVCAGLEIFDAGLVIGLGNRSRLYSAIETPRCIARRKIFVTVEQQLENDGAFLQWQKEGLQAGHTALQSSRTIGAQAYLFLQKVSGQEEKKWECLGSWMGTSTKPMITSRQQFWIISDIFHFRSCSQRRLRNLPSVHGRKGYQAMRCQGPRSAQAEIVARKRSRNPAVEYKTTQCL